MSRGMWFTHEVEYDVVTHVEVEVDLRAPTMRVWRHGVPDAAQLELGETHYELAALHAVRVNQFVDPAPICLRRITDGFGMNVGLPDDGRRVFCVGRCADEEKLRLSRRTI